MTARTCRATPSTLPSSTVSRIAKLSGGARVQVGDPSAYDGFCEYHRQVQWFAYYIGGGFAGLVTQSWNGSTWTTISGVTGTEVNALAVFGNRIYIGGNFNRYLVTSITVPASAPHFNTVNGRVWSLLAAPTRIFAGWLLHSSPSPVLPLALPFLCSGASPFTAPGRWIQQDVYAFTNFNGKIAGRWRIHDEQAVYPPPTGHLCPNDRCSGNRCGRCAHAFYPNSMIGPFRIRDSETRRHSSNQPFRIYDAVQDDWSAR